MINVKPIIKKILETICDCVFDGYPTEWENFPIIGIQEENNTPHTITDDEEQIANIRYRIDVWTYNESSSKLSMDVDEKMTSLGLVRTFGADAPEIRQGLKHKVLRYEGDVDVHTFHVYHD